MLLVENRKARQEYQFLETHVAGIVLSGAEVKSLRKKSASFFGSFVKIVGGELWLLNAQISPYEFADNRDYDPKRSRKLLVKKREVTDLSDKVKTKGLTLVPISFEALGRNIKLRFALAKGKKEFEKRAAIKQRDLERDLKRELKGSVRIK
jgi:SsrA-binding protein